MGLGGTSGLVTSGSTSTLAYGGRHPYHTRSFAKLQHFLKDTSRETELYPSKDSKKDPTRGRHKLVLRTHYRPNLYPREYMSGMSQTRRITNVHTGIDSMFSPGADGGRQILSPDLSRPRKMLELRPTKSDKDADETRSKDATLSSTQRVRFAETKSDTHRDDARNRAASKNYPDSSATTSIVSRRSSLSMDDENKFDDSTLSAATTTTPKGPIRPREEASDKFLLKHLDLPVSPQLSSGSLVATKTAGSPSVG